MNTPFDDARQQCSDFAWNLFSSIQLLGISMELDSRELDDNESKSYELLLASHCKHLANEEIQ